jgi:hypothetical protein
MMGISVKRDGGEQAIPITDYRKMLRDAEVASCLTLKELLMIPLIRTIPPDGDEKSKRATEFIIAVQDRMPGSAISVYRNQALHEALTTGMILGGLNFIKMEIPGFGMAQGLENITIANTEDFAGNTKLTETGAVEYFKQIRNGSENFTPGEVLYYGYKAISGNPEGESALHAAYDPWALKVKALINVYVSTVTSTSGLKIFKVPKDKYIEEKNIALAILSGMANSGNIAMPDDWDIDVTFPAGATLYALVKVIQESGNKPIRKAILYDETITAEGMNSWASGSNAETENRVLATMKEEGREFIESFIQEQVYRQILDENGMHDYPTPLAVSDAILADKDPTAVLLTLGTAKKDRVITGDLRPEEQNAIVKQLLNSIDIESQGLIPAAPAPVTEGLQAARVPKDRQKSKVNAEGTELVKREEEASTALADSWTAIVPNVSKSIISNLFDGGNVKTANLGTIMDIIESKIKTDGKVIQNVMLDYMMLEQELTYKKTKESLPSPKLQAAVNIGINPTRARQALKMRVRLMLQKTYGDMSSQLCYIMEEVIIGNTSPAVGQAQIQQFLMENGISAGRASTLMNTAMNTAHNSGKMAVYRPLEDPFGADPGSITGYQYVSNKGSFKEPICQGLENEFFRCNDPNLPNPGLHFGCSGTLSPVFAGEELWNGGKYLDPIKSAELMHSHGGVQLGFGG